MPTTVEIQAFKFQELTDQAKQEVITRLAPDDGWWDCVFDGAKEDGEKLCFGIEDISFTGFWSQGDGACWSGYVDVVPWLEKHKATDPQAHIVIALIEENWLEQKLPITYGGRHAHSRTMRCGSIHHVFPTKDNVLDKGMFQGASVLHLFDTLGIPLDNYYLGDLEMEMFVDARNFADEIYKRLRDEYEYLCSEEVIAELCDANEYLFTADGRFV